MKVIDRISLYELFTLIKENKAPSKIKYNNNIYEFDGKYYLTKQKNGRVCLGGKLNEINMLCIMFDENKIEILEDTPKKIEKHEIDKEWELERYYLDLKELNRNLIQVIKKQNEIIDYINKGEDNG